VGGCHCWVAWSQRLQLASPAEDRACTSNAAHASTCPAGGTYKEGTLLAKEPNEIDDNYPLDCVGANATQAYGTPKAWGWADSKCDVPRIYMCRKSSEWPGPGHRAGWCQQQARRAQAPLLHCFGVMRVNTR
jgi:hypothetical protein